MGGKLISNKGRYILYSKIFLIFLVMAIAVSALELPSNLDFRSNISNLSHNQDVLEENMSLEEESSLSEERDNEISEETDQEASEEVETEETKNAEMDIPLEELDLADTINGQNIYRDAYVEDYLEQKNYFQGINYERLHAGEKEYSLQIGNMFMNDYRGIVVDNERYALHLVFCDKVEKTCYLRMNGVLFKLSTEDAKLRTFEVNDALSLEVTSIAFENCGGKRFCNRLIDLKDILLFKIIVEDNTRGEPRAV